MNDDKKDTALTLLTEQCMQAFDTCSNARDGARRAMTIQTPDDMDLDEAFFCKLKFAAAILMLTENGMLDIAQIKNVLQNRRARKTKNRSR